CADIETYYLQNILPQKLVVDADYARRFGLLQDGLLLVRGVLAAIFGAITWQTLSRRRWQILHFLILSLAGLATMAAASWLGVTVGGRIDSTLILGSLLAAAVVKPACLLLFKIPRALASSVTADDFSRNVACAAASASLIACALLYSGHRDVGRLP